MWSDGTTKTGRLSAIPGLAVAQIFQPAPDVVRNGFKPQSSTVARPAQVGKPAYLLIDSQTDLNRELLDTYQGRSKLLPNLKINERPIGNFE